MKKLMLGMCVIAAFVGAPAFAETQVSKGEAISGGVVYGAALAAMEDAAIALGVGVGVIVALAIYEAYFPTQAIMAKESILKPSPNSNTVSLSQ